MEYVAVIDPPTSVVTAAEAVAAGIFPSTDNAGLIQTLLDIAQAKIDGPRGWLGRAIGPQVLEYRTDRFCREIVLPCPPVISIVSILYDNLSGAEMQVGDADWQSYGEGDNRIEFIGIGGWPSAICRQNSVRIQYEAGFPDEVPAEITRAIMLMARALKGYGIDQLGLVRSESVEGVGRIDYQLPTEAEASLRLMADGLLGSYRTILL